MAEAAASEGARIDGPSVPPRDAATLVLIDTSGAEPRILLGLRHGRHAFMPGRFVFPGGGVDAADSRMSSVGALDPLSERRLLTRLRRPSQVRARAFALTAIRETGEETGFLLGEPAEQPIKVPTADWQRFADAGVVPDLSALTFIFRAITPPQRPRRFDTRFFLAFRDAVATEHPGVIGPDAEFVEMRWFSFAEAEAGELPIVTKVVVKEAGRRLALKPAAQPPVPFFYVKHGRFHQETLD